MLAGVACATLAAAALAGVGPQVARLARFSLPLALLIAITNAIVVRDGLTVLVRFGEIPPFGQVDVTLEALAYGLLLALRVVVVVLPFALVAATVDPDVVLRGMRRLSFRSALTAALATRMIPVLTRDARRMEDARRCRPGGTDGSVGRLAVARAVTAGALDRSVDVAATLELRGFANARRAPHEAGPPLSRHDVAVAASAAGLFLLCAAGLAEGVATVDPYPTFGLRPAWRRGSTRPRSSRSRCCRLRAGGGSSREHADLRAVRGTAIRAVPGRRCATYRCTSMPASSSSWRGSRRPASRR